MKLPCGKAPKIGNCLWILNPVVGKKLNVKTVSRYSSCSQSERQIIKKSEYYTNFRSSIYSTNCFRSSPSLVNRSLNEDDQATVNGHRLYFGCTLHRSNSDHLRHWRIRLGPISGADFLYGVYYYFRLLFGRDRATNRADSSQTDLEQRQKYDSRQEIYGMWESIWGNIFGNFLKRFNIIVRAKLKLFNKPPKRTLHNINRRSVTETVMQEEVVVFCFSDLIRKCYFYVLIGPLI